MKKAIILVIILLLATLLCVGCIEDETDDYWTWELVGDPYSNNEITFTAEQLACCQNDNPVVVFSSIDPYWDFIYEYATQKNYMYNQENPDHNGGNLQHIEPDMLYYIYITQDCVLKIRKC